MRFYLVCCFATVLLPVPAFGVLAEVTERLQLPGPGLWISQPFRVIAFGFLYCALTGWSKLHDHA